MSQHYTYYIDGEEVGAEKARRYFEAGVMRSAERGYCDVADTSTMWANRDTEEGRELIFNLSGIQEQGGLEIEFDYEDEDE